MPWGLDRRTLEAGRDEKAALVAEDPWHHPLEELARAHRWLDEDTEARRRFGEAAADLEASFEARGRGDALSRGRTGGLLLQAGEPAAASEWFERALASLDVASPRDANRVAALRYLLGDPEGALVAAALAEEPDPILEPIATLAQARRDRDPGAAGRAREAIARLISAGRTPPFDESGSPDLTLFDWLEEALRVEADLRGEPLPDHAGMLERAGLVRAVKGAEVPDWPPPAGHHALTRTKPGGEGVEATVAVDADNDGVFVLDPRAGLTVRLIKEYGEYRVRIEWGDDEEGWYEEDLDHRTPGFRSGFDAAADWLLAHAPDPPGGAWAAETVRALGAAAYD
jgi:tetratricopeptide (TPR) repeat protein